MTQKSIAIKNHLYATALKFKQFNLISCIIDVTAKLSRGWVMKFQSLFRLILNIEYNHLFQLHHLHSLIHDREYKARDCCMTK